MKLVQKIKERRHENKSLELGVIGSGSSGREHLSREIDLEVGVHNSLEFGNQE